MSCQVRNIALGIVTRRINWQQLTMMETIDSKHIFLASHMACMFLTPPRDEYSLWNVCVLNLILAENSF